MQGTNKVYQAIIKVQAELAASGISKDKTNAQQGYKFRGIDDVYNAISSVLAKHSLCILPRMLSRQCTERMTAKGGVIFYVVVEAEFDFISAEDGSRHTVKTYGEAMDSADKATNKAMSAAYKYAAFQTFAIPTEGDNDADATTPPPIKPQLETKQSTKQTPEEPKKAEISEITKSVLFSIAKIKDVKAFLEFFEKLPSHQKIMSVDDFNEVWRALKARGLDFNLEWDKVDKVFISVLPPQTTETQATATH